ncbi:glucose-1-phosphate adenylyltransferase subunit GlgD [Aquibacillus albus]|uniref:Glucose-1-phosphate adenylyltransferase n=1 Tax=Aquibacillus albus TaxID=1168171 RepID=A0ABS2N5F3_9BACI|nr:glucose-1-phosphate adenylyltransferase subunit GlgD [Aquibacillus albus]MBM7573371.1 glucose-1-phosphate adenylyltransferase [Aquibacillus albus]
MKNNVLGIINVTQENHELHALTARRCHASLPYGGRYRIIDFILSSMVHSKIRNIAIFTPPNYRSLFDHLGSGKDWDLEYKQEGLFIFPKNSTFDNRDDFSVLNQHIDYLEKSRQEYVLISFGSLVMNIDFQPVIKQHIQSGADVTVVYKEKEVHDVSFTDITMDDFQNITSFNETDSPYGSLDIFVMKKDKFIESIKTNANKYRSLLDVLKNCDLTCNIKGYEYDGYVQKINSIQDYYRYNMELLDPYFLNEWLLKPNEIYTKLKDEPPAKYSASSEVKNAIIANGCVVEGNVENSILFRGVHVKKGATVKNSIVMQKSQIGENAELDGAIIDKEVVIFPYEHIEGTPNNPKVVTKQKIVGEQII